MEKTTYFKLIVRPPVFSLTSYLADAIKYFMNRYSLAAPFIIHNNQVIKLQKTDFDYFGYLPNFMSLGEAYIIIHFPTQNNRNYNDGQFFYPNKFLSQKGIYFNALNNFEQDYVYTNVAASILTDENTVQQIFSVQGIPLSFIDEQLVRIAYVSPVPPQQMGIALSQLNFDNSFMGKDDIFPVKYGPDGTRLSNNPKWPTLIGTDIYSNGFEGFLLFNRGYRPHYMMLYQMGMNDLTVAVNPDPQPLDPPGNMGIATMLGMQDYKSTGVNSIVTPYVFKFPIDYSFYNDLDFTQVGVFNVDFGFWIICSNGNQVKGFANDDSFNEIDCLLMYKTPMIGCTSLQTINQVGFGFETPFVTINRGNLQLKTRFDQTQNTLRQSETSAVYLLEFEVDQTYQDIQVGKEYRQLPFFQSSWPQRYHTYNVADGLWTTRTFGALNKFETFTYLEWDKPTDMDQLDLPPASSKVNVMITRKHKDHLIPSNYIRTTFNRRQRLIQANAGPPMTPCITNLYSWKSIMDNEMSIQSVPNFSIWRDARIFDEFGAAYGPNYSLQSDLFQNKFCVPQTNTFLPDITSTTSNSGKILNYGNETELNLLSHSFDNKPFSSGMRMLKRSFNYKQYFRMRHWPSYVLKKVINLRTEVEWNNEKGYGKTKNYNLNSLIFQEFGTMSITMLPDYCWNDTATSEVDGYDIGSYKNRGLGIKCSLTRRVRGIRQYSYLERGNKSFTIKHPYYNASQFFFEIYFDSAGASDESREKRTTVARQLKDGNDPKEPDYETMSIYILFH